MTVEKEAQLIIDAHMQKVAHRVMDVFENADEDALAEEVMEDVLSAIGIDHATNDETRVLSAEEKAEVARFGIHDEGPGLPEVTYE